VFRKWAEKYLCWAEFCAIVVLSGLPCKQSGCQGATYVLYVALNGKKVSCLQSERNALSVCTRFGLQPCELDTSAKKSSHSGHQQLIYRNHSRLSKTSVEPSIRNAVNTARAYVAHDGKTRPAFQRKKHTKRQFTRSLMLSQLRRSSSLQ
jgi:hypothetical protein